MTGTPRNAALVSALHLSGTGAVMPHPRDMDDDRNWAIYSPEKEDGRTDWPSKIFQAVLGLAVVVLLVTIAGYR